MNMNHLLIDIPHILDINLIHMWRLYNHLIFFVHPTFLILFCRDVNCSSLWSLYDIKHVVRSLTIILASEHI